jgi:hypothetical protein
VTAFISGAGLCLVIVGSASHPRTLGHTLENLSVFKGFGLSIATALQELSGKERLSHAIILVHPSLAKLQDWGVVLNERWGR